MPVFQKMSSTEQARFSTSGDRLAVTTADGRLTLWKEGVAQCEQQFVPSNHLEAHSTCLAWASNNSRRKKKKNKDKLDNSMMTLDNTSDLVAIGTSAGTLLIYSVRQGDLVTTINKENSNKINSLVWANSGTSIFAAGEDGCVSIFSVSKLAFMSSFQAGTDPIFSLAMSKDDSLVATGSRAIRVWDVASQRLVKTLTGHANPVINMRIESGLLVSAAEDDRTMSVWSLETDKLNTSLVSLSVNEAVTDFDIVTVNGEINVVVVSREGKLYTFRFPEDKKKSKKPLGPVNSVIVTSCKDESGRVEPITMLGAKWEIREELEINVAHGTVLRPVVERLVVSELSQSHCLVRDSSVVKVNSQQGDFTKTVTPKTEGDVVFLAPGVTQPLGPGKLGKRKQSKETKDESLPMEDRLALLSTATIEGVNTPPRADSLAQLLAQGLHGNDSRILSSVLDRTDSQLIDNTVRRMPVEAIVPLVTILMRYIKGRGMVHSSHAKWLRSVLTLHTGYLVSVPDCQDLLTPVYSLLEARTSHYSQVLQLRGKLELLTKQTEEKVETEVNTDKDALLVYQDESSDELEDVIDDLLVPESETDDNWEDDDEKNDEDMEEDDNSDSDCVEIVNGDDNEEEMESDND